MGRVVDDEWRIRIQQRYLNNDAGAGARQKEQQLAGGKSWAQRYFERAFDVRTEDRSWRRGAEGEERVAALLEHLDDRWAVIHDLTIGRRGANLDHLVIGPPGVFVLNTKHLTGSITVYEHAVLHNGHKTSYVPAALREARTVQERLSRAAGRPINAWSVIVVLDCKVQVRKPLANLSLVRAHKLPRWLSSLPLGKLTPAQVTELERVARTPATWTPGRRRATADRQGPPTFATTTVIAKLPPRGRGGVTVRRWTKYGKDRLYANSADGLRLGYIEVESGEIVLEVADESGVIAAQLRASRRALGKR